MASTDKRNVAVRISPDAVRQVRGGSPWVFDGSIDSVSFDAPAGTLAVLFDRKRAFVGLGLYDPHSPIRVRVLHVGGQARIDGAFFIGRIRDAIRGRAGLFSGSSEGDVAPTTAGRLVNGENDRLPGLIIDRYDTTAVVKLYSAGWLPYLDVIVEALGPGSAARVDGAQPDRVDERGPDIDRVVLRLARSVRDLDIVADGELGDGVVVYGNPVDGPVLFRENGLWFAADVIAGQKTGHFLDQRDNRARVRELAVDDDVLDVFAATGGFSVHALAGGARSVTLIDQSSASLAVATTNLALNGFDVVSDNQGGAADGVGHRRVRLAVGDAYGELSSLAASKRSFDMVIVDPPSFAPSNAAVPKALAAYGRLTELALDVLRPGGLLVQCSCSSRIGADEFFSTVHTAAQRAGRPLGEIERTYHPVDHPIGFEYGAYLKALFAYAP